MPQNFSRRRLGKRIANLKHARNFVSRQMRLGELAQTFAARWMRAKLWRDDRAQAKHRFAQADRNHHAAFDCFVSRENFFDFQWIDFEPADVDEKFQSAGDSEIAARVDHAEIAGWKKPI